MIPFFDKKEDSEQKKKRLKWQRTFAAYIPYFAGGAFVLLLLVGIGTGVFFWLRKPDTYLVSFL